MAPIYSLSRDQQTTQTMRPVQICNGVLIGVHVFTIRADGGTLQAISKEADLNLYGRTSLSSQYSGFSPFAGTEVGRPGVPA